MPKTVTDTPGQRATRLTGPTMGTTWQVLVDDPLCAADHARLITAFQTAVDTVDAQMSTWKPDSTVMRLNAAALNSWFPVPPALLTVLEAGLAISRATNGAFEMNMGAAVRAWGFGPGPMDLSAIRAASTAPRIRATEALQIDASLGLARKTAPLSLDLSGIAKGYGVDRLAETAAARGICHALCSIDGEVRALGARRCGTPWAVGIDAPVSADHATPRGSHSVIALADTAVATSGTYRHFVDIRGIRLSHTMNPRSATPVVNAPASVTVMGQSCMMADAMATALMVMGVQEGSTFARAQGLHSLFLASDGQGRLATATGLFTA